MAGAGGGAISIGYRTANEGAVVMLPWFTGADHICDEYGPATGAVAMTFEG